MTRRLTRLILVSAVAVLLGATGMMAATASNGCGHLGVKCGVGADQPAGTFHGLVAVHGVPWVLDVAARAGTQPGCGDCTWEIVIACHTEAPGAPGNPRDCDGANNSAGCPKHQLRYQIYLTTDAVTNLLEGTICLGGGKDPIPIGDHAAGDVQRYLKNVTPPNLKVATRPTAATLAGLLTYFSASPPADLTPAPFGSGEITETITVAPSVIDWRWGDGAASGWASAATTATHSYLHGGNASVRLTTRWGATYTISYEGQTYGPYHATGALTKQQTLALAVDTSSPTLVSQ
jgi:hypothetical protein